jgi:hypothetical protein
MLDELVPAFEDEYGDWDDVLARAGVERTAAPPPEPRRRRRRGVTALAIAIALLVALLATPAFGLRDAVLDLIGRIDVTFAEAPRAPERVVREFEDLGLGAPPRLAPQAVAGETRRVGTLRVRGRERTLWVAPTRNGGFCYRIEGAWGGCERLRTRPAPPLSLTYAVAARRGQPARVTQLGGTIMSPRVTHVVVVFRDGHREPVPFVYVSPPIAAGFFVYDVPAGRVPLHVLASDDRWRVLFRSDDIRAGVPARVAGPRRATPRTLPLRPPVEPSPPLQRGSANGVSVVAGRNGAAAFDNTRAPESLARLLRRGPVDYACYRFRRGEARGYGIMGTFGRTAGVRFFGIGTPFEACEVRGSYGHRWPDRFGSHSAVEIAFTPRARRWFEDRAAARQLALFVRMREVQRIRGLRGAKLARALAAFEPSVVHATRPPAGRIGWWARGDTLFFSRLSTTGRRFEVEVRGRRVVRQNVRPLALVF